MKLRWIQHMSSVLKIREFLFQNPRENAQNHEGYKVLVPYMLYIPVLSIINSIWKGRNLKHKLLITSHSMGSQHSEN